MVNRIAILVPVLDDWQAFERLLHEIACAAAGLSISLDVVAVDDGSAEAFAIDEPALPLGAIGCIEILRLGLNLGHQRAIAVGLTEIAKRDHLDGVLVMDCDGEDRPSDLPRLLAAGRDHPARIIVARRAQRSEGRSFRFGYLLYRILFALLTGERISFGNFSLIPMACVRRLVLMPEIWNNLPAAILRSRIGLISVSTARGTRYADGSRMNWVGLVAHGLSAMSVYIDVVFVRVLFASAVIAGMTVLAIIAALAFRLATQLAPPGWATTVIAVLGLLLTQLAIMVVAMLLLVLAGRNARPIVPISDAGIYVAAHRRYGPDASSADAIIPPAGALANQCPENGPAEELRATRSLAKATP